MGEAVTLIMPMMEHGFEEERRATASARKQAARMLRWFQAGASSPSRPSRYRPPNERRVLHRLRERVRAGRRSRDSSDLAGSAVWRCPDCPDSWARHIEATGGPGEPPSGPETQGRPGAAPARAHRAPARAGGAPGARYAHHRAGPHRVLARQAARHGRRARRPLGFMGIDQLRRAWGILGRASYRQILEAARNKQPRSTRHPSQRSIAHDRTVAHSAPRMRPPTSGRGSA